ncbi:Prephenate dehydratase [Bacteroides coprosuis DSM 18011]|uniref:prephenate dehydratase n=1 Tax=Bacteroides coprosuis DSM 18011 TaxID=679937 RepID=F3ZPJ3_9BACE|nr:MULTISPECIES: prephenate dehydratase [Bacteroides]EGJ70352.1 Prephenate dehydratase [Bacteroides coprosuis DSM 18011]HJD91679.1 prephenate dehydratase [Bacteroides coprosuis]
MKKIAIQGVHGSYHDIAAHQYFKGEELELICCSTFEEIFESIINDQEVIGMLAIENTIAGSLLHNNELLRLSNTNIVGEHKLRISHCIACLPNQSWDDIKEVNSHPIALMQCRSFLQAHPSMRVVESEDTALSAEEINKNQIEGHAAICSKYAAQINKLKILEEGIETNKHNFTRFLIAQSRIAENKIIPQNRNKASMVFTLPHKLGSLAPVLSILSFYTMNLTKIQSLPIIGREWEYQFYIDITFSDYEQYKQALNAIAPLTNDLKILGEYEEGQYNV